MQIQLHRKNEGFVFVLFLFLNTLFLLQSCNLFSNIRTKRKAAYSSLLTGLSLVKILEFCHNLSDTALCPFHILDASEALITAHKN